MQADAMNRELLDRTQRSASEKRVALESRALRANTVAPGKFATGRVVIELPTRSRKSPVPLELTLTAGMDQFKFGLTERFD